MKMAMNRSTITGSAVATAHRKPATAHHCIFEPSSPLERPPRVIIVARMQQERREGHDPTGSPASAHAQAGARMEALASCCEAAAKGCKGKWMGHFVLAAVVLP